MSRKCGSLHYSYPGNGFQHSSYVTRKVFFFFSRPNSFVAISLSSLLQVPTPELDSIQFLCSQARIVAGWRLETQLTQIIFFVHFITPRHGPCRKRNLPIAQKTCFQRCCTATEVILLSLAYSLQWECVYRAVA
jgi:hypothetical protein